MKIRIIILILITLTLSAYFALVLYTEANRQKGERYYLPESYAGWVCVSFNVDGAPPLPTDDGFLVIKVPSNGILKTSTEPRFSPKIDEYFYYNEKSIREAEELQHGGGSTVQMKDKKEITFHFWVSNGSRESDYEKYVKNKNNSVTECGPWKK